MIFFFFLQVRQTKPLAILESEVKDLNQFIFLIPTVSNKNTFLLIGEENIRLLSKKKQIGMYLKKMKVGKCIMITFSTLTFRFQGLYEWHDCLVLNFEG